MKTTVILEFEHSKPLPMLADLAAQRAYTLSGVENVRVMELRAVEEVPAKPLANERRIPQAQSFFKPSA